MEEAEDPRLTFTRQLAQTKANQDNRAQNIYFIKTASMSFYVFGPDGSLQFMRSMYPEATIQRIDSVHPAGQEPFIERKITE